MEGANVEEVVLFRRGRIILGGGISEFVVAPATTAMAGGGASLGTVLSASGVLSLSASGSMVNGEVTARGMVEGVEGRDID